jgi:NAD(P)-dependent dehydrogenase (short-subunit alcohol dehydrogenase family)
LTGSLVGVRIALVSGATRGIGREIFRHLAQRDHTVLLGARDLAQGETAAAELPGDVRAVRLDVNDPPISDALAGRIEGEHGRLDVIAF